MISLTQLAADKVKSFIEKRGKGEGIRVGVKTTGCSGLAYTLEFVDKVNQDDLKFESYNVNIFVDPKSIVYLNDMSMDWKKSGLNEGFEFINPNESARCGCGESFKV